jgi:Cu/Ag efflux protein CusF
MDSIGPRNAKREKSLKGTIPMKSILFAATLLISQLVFATEPPAHYPIVKGEVRRVELASNRITIKHEEIPNLNMPPMTMSFLAQDPSLLQGLVVGDKINFVADQIDDELTVLWLEKVTTPGPVRSLVSCTGIAPTTPKTNVEIEINADKFSTIRYEYAEGSYQGTSYINSIGDMKPRHEGAHYAYQSGEGRMATILEYDLQGATIANSLFTHFGAGMHRTAVQCKLE